MQLKLLILPNANVVVLVGRFQELVEKGAHQFPAAFCN